MICGCFAVFLRCKNQANEFTILCDVDTVIIVYPPNSNHPEIWPENPDQIKKTIASYKAKKSESGKRTYDLNDFFQDRKKKIEDELMKVRKRNMEAKYSTWFDELNGLSEGQLRQFAIGLENKESIVRNHLELKKRTFNMQIPFRFELENNQPGGIHYVGSYPSLDQVQVVNHQLMNHDIGWFNDAAASTSFIPLKHEMGSFGYPMIDGGVIYDNSNPWAFQPVMQCGLMPELALQDPHVNQDAYDGVGDFVMDDHRGRFMG
ncbi:hypothetical protein L6452_22610 [Arctium lappa]|uniref:Uncharacterized protein n=1 Tax=Arctium lappa TaxID=4217 RepID=A0ACB9AZV5_ARCLA|nr:hypothetical protein L6452_22610 [Arctium lappa]